MTAASRAGAPSWQGQRAEPTRLVLLRHGQTPLSVDRRYSGRGNPDLTEVGRRQAAAAAARIADTESVAAIVSSPLSRAVDTATAVARSTGLAVDIDDDLTETDFGGWEGLTFTEAAERDPDLHGRWLADVDVATPGGESFAEVAIRVSAARARIVERFGAATVVVVSHVTPIKSLLREALGAGPQLLYRLHLDLASVSVAEFYPDGGSVVRLANGTEHLRSA